MKANISKLKRFILLALASALALANTVFAAAADEAYDMMSQAQAKTHREGPFKLRGEETSVSVETVSGKTTKSTRYYALTGYDLHAAETYIQFETRIPDPSTGALRGGPDSVRTAFLLTPERIYIRTPGPAASSEWTERDLTALLPKFISLGTLDQFFMLELLNGGRLGIYKSYMTPGADAQINGQAHSAVKVDISRAQFTALAGELTKDIKALLGPAADGMGEFQLGVLQAFARSMLESMNAEIHFIVYINKATGCITRIESKMDMANPYGSKLPGAVSRIQSDAFVSLYDFGKEVTRIKAE